jgi:predicted AAA+ superfamily ATPase
MAHFIFMELVAHRSHSELDYDINFWRTKTGLEVDFVLAGGEVAIEVKGTSRVDTRDLTALSKFVEEFSPKHAIVVCTESKERVIGSIRIMPWKAFLEKLWKGAFIK